MKVAGYFRESDDDSSKAPPIERQVERYHQWCKENGHESVTEYADDGYSGGDWKRPAWNQSVNDARRHAWQVLWVWNQDRIARDTEQFLWYHRNLKEASVKIWEDTSNAWVDMDELGGRVKHQTLAQAGEIFRLVTSDKVKQAYRRKKAKNESWGRPAKDFDKDLALQLRKQGLGWREIAKRCGVSYQTVRRYLLGLLCNTGENDGNPPKNNDGDFVTEIKRPVDLNTPEIEAGEIEGTGTPL